MGTGIRTALPMVAADELEADWQRVTVEQAIGDPKYGDQNTDGSKSIRDFYDALRQAGATGRLMLERAAAAKWGVPVSQCQAFNHQIIHVPSGRSLGYGELAPLAAQQPVPKKDELRFKSPAEFRYIGIGTPIVDLDAICTGKATYGIDAQMPGMVYASIARSPVIGGTLKPFLACLSFFPRILRSSSARGTAPVDRTSHEDGTAQRRLKWPNHYLCRFC